MWRRPRAVRYLGARMLTCAFRFNVVDGLLFSLFFSGNEPDLKQPFIGGFWTGSQADYFQLYAEAARALKRVSPRLQVGGPATSVAPTWVADFLAFGDSAQVPIDFVSSHFCKDLDVVAHPEPTSLTPS